ncbi:hypothetical protein SAMD00019534_121130 [Acytostelium subglobosum LB1]|uniref:hypothetical protein n=1 Tax=Acytostelium subglobosum LB1 TaxID=1410327 RepID=UPI000644CC08|nr:hypothetical protein SAMD00019534_121130 [Acytostelium subglobosum LB1]GAM28937.1 hypothetical protein SAMD00019534_121130 [Acytostelium subglobosum LB1]|eukprot:XP_012748122.1 hypothetical protein SAMD00019534_121130 [Acytostelium subglobosum LB1]
MFELFEKTLTLLLLVENSTRQLNNNQSLFQQFTEMMSTNDSSSSSALLELCSGNETLIPLFTQLSKLSSCIDITQLLDTPVATPSPSCNNNHNNNNITNSNSLLNSLYSPKSSSENLLANLAASSSSSQLDSANSTPVLHGLDSSSNSSSRGSSPFQHSVSDLPPLSIQGDDDMDDTNSNLCSSSNMVPCSPPNGGSIKGSYSMSGSSNNSNNSNSKRKRRPRAPAPFFDTLFCHSCGETQTSQWRRGPDGCKSLCNACGIRFANIVNKEKALAAKETSKCISINMLLCDSAQAEANNAIANASVSNTINLLNDSFPVVPTVATATSASATIAQQFQQLNKSVPYYNSSKLAYAPPPPPKGKLSSSANSLPTSTTTATPSTSNTHKRKQPSTTDVSMPTKSHKVFQHDDNLYNNNNMHNEVASNTSESFNFSSFPMLDALTTLTSLASSEAQLISAGVDV